MHACWHFEGCAACSCGSDKAIVPGSQLSVQVIAAPASHAHCMVGPVGGHHACVSAPYAHGLALLEKSPCCLYVR